MLPQSWEHGTPADRLSYSERGPHSGPYTRTGSLFFWYRQIAKVHFQRNVEKHRGGRVGKPVVGGATGQILEAILHTHGSVSFGPLLAGLGQPLDTAELLGEEARPDVVARDRVWVVDARQAEGAVVVLVADGEAHGLTDEDAARVVVARAIGRGAVIGRAEDGLGCLDRGEGSAAAGALFGACDQRELTFTRASRAEHERGREEQQRKGQGRPMGNHQREPISFQAVR